MKIGEPSICGKFFSFLSILPLLPFSLQKILENQPVEIFADKLAGR
jgi:hypothetical protein